MLEKIVDLIWRGAMLIGTMALLMLVGFGVTACSTDSALRAQIAGANIELARHKAETAAKPILDAQIPTPSGMMVIIVHAPQGANTAQITMPDDPWARAADRAVGVLGTAAGLYLGGEAAVGLVSASTQGVVNALRVQPAPTVVTQPAPVIVPPADPVIVTQPAPVIVDPVVVDPVIVTRPDPLVVQPVIVGP
jgi:hypothetical protein